MLGSECREWLLKLARGVVDSAARGERHVAAAADGIPTEARQVRGGFVTLTIRGALRGCIGEIFPRRELWRVVEEQAYNAAVNDPRFEPLRASEAVAVRIEISALTPPEVIGSWREIEVGRHGVVLERGETGAVFLPQVATEQGWDVETMLSHLAYKAGLPREAWREGCSFQVFEAEVFGE
jgi:AmmeMemoRadiSam system protein A